MVLLQQFLPAIRRISSELFIHLLIKAKGHKGHLHRSKNYYAKIQIESPYHIRK